MTMPRCNFPGLWHTLMLPSILDPTAARPTETAVLAKLPTMQAAGVAAMPTAKLPIILFVGEVGVYLSLFMLSSVFFQVSRSDCIELFISMSMLSIVFFEISRSPCIDRWISMSMLSNVLFEMSFSACTDLWVSITIPSSNISWLWLSLMLPSILDPTAARPTATAVMARLLTMLAVFALASICFLSLFASSDTACLSAVTAFPSSCNCTLVFDSGCFSSSSFVFSTVISVSNSRRLISTVFTSRSLFSSSNIFAFS
mmetsp:Transcript_6443/g.15648  ORF Transcript_6443/g.15648 Transcript_6443/m.15648 type:complete len:257 (+) Transcript_6443:328-1098(+)